MKNLVMNIRRFVREEEGATAIEYGLLAAFIAVAIAATAKTLGTNLNTIFDKIASCVGTTHVCS